MPLARHSLTCNCPICGGPAIPSRGGRLWRCDPCELEFNLLVLGRGPVENPVKNGSDLTSAAQREAPPTQTGGALEMFPAINRGRQGGQNKPLSGKGPFHEASYMPSR
jgi:hypothetical protein